MNAGAFGVRIQVVARRWGLFEYQAINQRQELMVRVRRTRLDTQETILTRSGSLQLFIGHKALGHR